MSLDNWLKADDKNIAVVHCKGGKGRTGTLISSYMFYVGLFDDIQEAQNHFAKRRSKSQTGVTQASQLRYFVFFTNK